MVSTASQSVLSGAIEAESAKLAPATVGVKMKANEYHALPGVSNSRLWDFMLDPRVYHHKYLSGAHKEEQKSHFDFGSAVHDICLLDTRDDIAVIPKDVLSKSGAKSGNAWKEWTAEHSDKIQLKEHEYKSVMACVNSIRADPVAGRLLSTFGATECCYQYTDEELGLILRCRTDKLLVCPDRNIVIDIKTTESNTRPDKFVKSVVNFGYHNQECFYRKVLASKGIEVTAFVFLVVGVKPPHTVDCYTLSDAFREIGMLQIETALRDLSDRTRANNWSLDNTDVVELSPPNYLKPRGEYEL